MKIKWPEKKNLYNAQLTISTVNHFEGWNAAIEACQKSVEEAKGEGLVELDEESLAQEFYAGYERDCKALDHLSRVKFDKWEDLPKDDKMRMAFILRAREICSTFATPKPRPVVTEGKDKK